jgi:hypothetical protein
MYIYTYHIQGAEQSYMYPDGSEDKDFSKGSLLYINTCIYVYIYVYIYLHMYIYLYISMYEFVLKNAYNRPYVTVVKVLRFPYLYIQIYDFECTFLCMYYKHLCFVCLYRHVYVYVYIYIYMYIYICIDIHVYKYIYT